MSLASAMSLTHILPCPCPHGHHPSYVPCAVRHDCVPINSCSPVPMNLAAGLFPLRHFHNCVPPAPCHSLVPCGPARSMFLHGPCCCQLLCTLHRGHVLHSHCHGGVPCGHHHLRGSAQLCPDFTPAEQAGSSALRPERNFLLVKTRQAPPHLPSQDSDAGGVGGCKT